MAVTVGFASSNTWGDGGEIGNISEGGGSGEHFVEGGMNQRQRREPAGPPQDIGSGQMRGGVAPGLGDSEEIPDRLSNDHFLKHHQYCNCIFSGVHANSEHLP